MSEKRTCVTCEHHGWGYWGDAPDPYCYHPLSRQTTYAEDGVRGKYVVRDRATSCDEMRKGASCGSEGLLWRKRTPGWVAAVKFLVGWLGGSLLLTWVWLWITK